MQTPSKKDNESRANTNARNQNKSKRVASVRLNLNLYFLQSMCVVLYVQFLHYINLNQSRVSCRLNHTWKFHLKEIGCVFLFRKLLLPLEGPQWAANPHFVIYPTPPPPLVWLHVLSVPDFFISTRQKRLENPFVGISSYFLKGLSRRDGSGRNYRLIR
jgi:hypothetical protein